MSQLFAPIVNHSAMQHAPMGTRTSNGRYKMPLLPGEEGTKSGGDWVPRGLQSMTNLASSISDTKALGDWKLRQALIGIGLHPELAGQLMTMVYEAKAADADFQNLRAHPELSAALDAVTEKAWDIGGANAARDAGIAAHDAWEKRGTDGQTQLFSEGLGALEGLLDAAGMDRVPELRERVVRNTEVDAGGRFDDIVIHRKSGRLLMADLKTKAGDEEGKDPFWTWLEIDAQEAGYAYSDWMLTPDGMSYVDGPRRLGVDLTVGVVLHMPSNGGEPRLRKADLVSGWETLQLARRVCTQRSYGKSAGRIAESWWPVS